MEAACRGRELFTKKDLNKLIRPLVIEQLLAVSVGMFDTMMISSLGDTAVSGVSIVDMINVLMINIFASLATGGAVVCAHELGLARVADGVPDYSGARRGAKHLILCVGLVSVVVAALCHFFRAELLWLIFGHREREVLAHGAVYLGITSLSYPFIAIYNGFAALFRTMGNSKVTMITSFIVNAVNIGGNALFIYAFDFGVAGAAWSSNIARIVGMIILAVLITNKSRPIYISFKEKFRVDFGTVKRILKIGVPNGLENSVFRLGRILVISMITIFGTEQLAANAVAIHLDSLGCVAGNAIGLAMVTVVGQCIGAGDLDGALRYEKKLLRMSYIYMAVIQSAIIISLPLILSLYKASDEALSIARTLIILHNGFGIILWPSAFVIPNALRAAKDAHFSMIISVSSMIFFRLLLGYIIGVHLEVGIIGIWIAMIIDWLFRAVMFTYRIKSGQWLKFVRE